MRISDTHTVELLNRSVPDAARDIVQIVPIPSQLHARPVVADWTELAVLDLRWGNAWPILFGDALAQEYERTGHAVEGFIAEMMSPLDNSGLGVRFRLKS